MNRKLIFDENYNNKLNCKAFTTIRKRKKGKFYSVGDKFDIYLKDEFLFVAECMDVYTTYVDKMRDMPAYIDVGCNAKGLIEILTNLYGEVAVKESLFDVLVLVKAGK